MPDEITFEILDDGTIKIEAGRVSAANHLNAENFLREAARMAGGQVKVKHKQGHHQHAHSHSHGQHKHQH